jgi:hypothetical protein
MIIFAVKRPVKVVGKPCAGKLHARFDEGLLGRRNIKPVTYSITRCLVNCLEVLSTGSLQVI